MTQPPLKVNRTMPGLACLILLLLQVLQVDSRTLHREKREGLPCTKLEFELKDPNKCVPCTFCNPNNESKHFHPECKQKNPHSIPHHEGQVLWCFKPDNPLPECRPLPEDFVLNRAGKCNDQYGRKYPPGCEQTLSCGDEAGLFVRCGLNLTWEEKVWNENSRFEKCSETWTSRTLPPTTETTSTLPPAEKTTSLMGNTVVWVIPLVIIFGVGVVVAGLYLYYKRVGETSSRSPASSSESSSENGSNSKLVQATATETEKPQKMEEKRKLLITGGKDVDLENNAEREEMEVTLPNEDSLREENKFQMRETSTALVDLGMDKKEKDTEVELTEGGHNLTLETQKKSSCKALQALLRDRSKLAEFTKMFDQEYTYGQTTWHVVAGKLLQWGPDDVKSSEYLIRPQNSGCPGDGVMYKVMKEMHQAGMGLLDLLDCLRSLQFRNPTAEDLLDKFWTKWKSEHTTRSEGIC